MTEDNINYDELLKHMDSAAPIQSTNVTNVGLNNQFKNSFTTESVSNVNKENNIENIFPKNLVENSSEKSMENNKNIDPKENIELEIIKKSIIDQKEGLDQTNVKIEKLIDIMKSQDISKFYETVINIPRLIKKQMNEKYRYKKHSLIISSRDRDLTNKDFSKYDFRVVFGDTASNTISKRLVNSSSNSIKISRNNIGGNLLVLDSTTKNNGASGTLRYFNPLYRNNYLNIYNGNNLQGALTIDEEIEGSISEIELVIDTTNNQPKRSNGWAIGDRVEIENSI